MNKKLKNNWKPKSKWKNEHKKTHEHLLVGKQGLSKIWKSLIFL